MNISAVRPGMRLRCTREHQSHDREIEVTELFEHVFEIKVPAIRFRIPDDRDPGELHWSMPIAREGRELWAMITHAVRPEIDYEPMDAPGFTEELAARDEMMNAAELAEREAMLAVQGAM